MIGKFYPPHKGHKYLIQTAEKQVDHLVVVVCDLDTQEIPADLRAKWLQEIHPSVEVMVVKDIGKDGDSEAWAKYTREFLGYAPDIVFTSEDYGHDYARFLGAKHVLVDKERVNVPISATKIRNDVFAHWDYLESCVKKHFAKRIVVLGAESTGTTTLSRSLAEYYQTAWVPELGRFYSEGKLPSINAEKWATTEFVDIADLQNKFEDSLAGICNKVLICDTDSFATSLWHERYVGEKSTQVENLNRDRDYDLYILTADDIPFVQDGLRDGEHIRHWMHERFIEELQKQNKNFIIVSGTHENRMGIATRKIDELLETEKFFSKNQKTMADMSLPLLSCDKAVI